MSDVMRNNLDSLHQTLGDFPFSQKEKEGKLERVFSFEVDEEELKWHTDEKDRVVTILESNGWGFQMEDSLPIKMRNGQEIFIPKFVWHRVIKGEGSLKISILEFD